MEARTLPDRSSFASFPSTPQIGSMESRPLEAWSVGRAKYPSNYRFCSTLETGRCVSLPMLSSKREKKSAGLPTINLAVLRYKERGKGGGGKEGVVVLRPAITFPLFRSWRRSFRLSSSYPPGTQSPPRLHRISTERRVKETERERETKKRMEAERVERSG